MGPRLARIIGALLLAGGLAACSAVRIAYNSLPEVSYWWLDSYVDFEAAQTPRVRDALTQLLAWHRQDELPKLAELLRQTRALAADDVTAAQACELADAIRARLLAVAEHTAPSGAELVASLSDAQLAHIERKHARVNADYAKAWLDLSREDQQEKRYEQFLDRSEDFYGRLDPEQRELLRQQAAASMFDPREVDANRRRHQQEVLALLRRLQGGRLPAAEAQGAIRDYARRFAQPPAPMRERLRAQQEETCRDVAELHNRTSPGQRQKAQQRLQAYENDVRQLAAAAF